MSHQEVIILERNWIFLNDFNWNPYFCSGWEKILDLLIDTGSNVNSQAIDGSTPLMIAAQEGVIEINNRLVAMRLYIYLVIQFT